MARWHETLFPVLEELGIGFVAFSPLANGFLSARYDASSKFAAGTDYRRIMPQFSAAAADTNAELPRLLFETAAEHHATPAQISLAWMLAKKPYIVHLPRTRKLSRLAENAGAAEVKLTTAEVAKIDATLDSMPMSAVFGARRLALNKISGTQKGAP